jgi:flagellar protein FlgJ
MASSISMGTPGFNPLDLLNANTPKPGQFSAASKEKAKAAAQDFESVFVNSMFQQMFAGVQGDGPFGGNGATGVWRSFLTDEYSKSFVKSGGIGIADQVYQSLIKAQEARS